MLLLAYLLDKINNNLHIIIVGLLEGNIHIFTKAKFLKVGETSKLDHGWRATHGVSGTSFPEEGDGQKSFQHSQTLNCTTNLGSGQCAKTNERM